MTAATLTTARTLIAAGISVIPIHDDGSKAPTLKWKLFQERTPTTKEVDGWLRNSGKGIAVVTGAVSGNLETFDADAPELFDQWAANVEHDAPGLLARIPMAATPTGGRHLYYRCDAPPPGNMKLAQRHPTPAEQAAAPGLLAVVLFETRGEGGYAIVPPSPAACHPSGKPYVMLNLAIEDAPTLTADERAILISNARIFNTYVPAAQVVRGTKPRSNATGDERPGDRYNREADWSDLLPRHGWHSMGVRGEVEMWQRPGKDGRGLSATTNYGGSNLLYVFSSSAAPFEPEHAYSLFAAKVLLEHNGDYSEAGKALWKEQQMNTPTPSKPRVNTATGEILNGDDRPAPRPAIETEDGNRYILVPKIPLDVNDLLTMERKPVVWYAPNFLREGLGLIVGQPNVGKTPAAVQLAIALATGTKWLGAIECPQCNVLYLGVEYSAQELIPMFDISRMGMSIPRGRLHVKTIEDDFPQTPEDALAELDWYMRVMQINVVIIDVLTAFLPPEKFKQNVYRGDYSELKPYHKLALHYNAAILGVWHASKREADPKIMYNGSTGMWAAAASRMAMYQDQEQRVRIASFPRMGDKVDWALTQEVTSRGRRWIVSDTAPEPMMGSTEQAIYRFLKDNATDVLPLGPGTIAEMTGLPNNTVKVTVRRMFLKNLLQQVGSSGGYYVEPAKTPEDVVTDETLETSVTDVTFVTSDDLFEAQKVTNVTDCNPVCNPVSAHQDAANEGGLQKLHDIPGYKVSGAVTTNYSYDGVQSGNGPVVWRVFNDTTDAIVGEYTSEADAIAAINQRVQQ